MNILICAVGGQGALLTSRIFGRLAQNLDLDVKLSEVHGMSQRGGSVVTYVKFGKVIYSPIIEMGTADVVLAFELLEGARYASYLKPKGTLIVSSQRIDPMPVITGAMEYPDKIIDELRELPIGIYEVNALELAEKAGSIRASNVVLLGVLAKNTDITKENWIKAIEETVPKSLLEVNLKAFDFGYEVETATL